MGRVSALVLCVIDMLRIDNQYVVKSTHEFIRGLKITSV